MLILLHTYIYMYNILIQPLPLKVSEYETILYYYTSSTIYLSIF